MFMVEPEFILELFVVGASLQKQSLEFGLRNIKLFSRAYIE